ncbi:unnamed protein product [Coregonus sp. 'balchen']|nr:unnamed protein product [Coregonus sp. 'balchen']
MFRLHVPFSISSSGPSENLTETDGYFCSGAWFFLSAVLSLWTLRRSIRWTTSGEAWLSSSTRSASSGVWGCMNRNGTNADRYNLVKRFQDLNFEVQAYDNLKVEEVLDKISEAAEDNHADADCFVCVFLSHGESNYVYAYDDKISIQDITALFKGDKCKSLVGKPKIFILQACRGEKHDEPVTPMDVVDSEVKTNEVVVDAGVVYTLPAGADFIMCYSVAEGYYSHRETINGSWYIQDLCGAVCKFGDSLEFTELLTLVNRKVSMRSVGNCNDRTAIGKKQVPCFASMLTKKLYFRPKKQ